MPEASRRMRILPRKEGDRPGCPHPGEIPIVGRNRRNSVQRRRAIAVVLATRRRRSEPATDIDDVRRGEREARVALL